MTTGTLEYDETGRTPSYRALVGGPVVRGERKERMSWTLMLMLMGMARRRWNSPVRTRCKIQIDVSVCFI